MKKNGLLAMAAGAGALLGARTVVRFIRRLDFTGATVVITGGSRGLGLVLARESVARGAHPVLIARTAEELEAARDEFGLRRDGVMTVQCDVRNREDVERAIGDVVRERGRIDVLINNAGIIQVAPQEHMTIKDFEDAMATHFYGPLYAMLACIPVMLHQSKGRIVNIASFGGKVAVPHLMPYCASKFALVGLSDGMRSELAKYGIRVTTVSPGLMRTGSHINITLKGRHEEEFAWFAGAAGAPLISMDARRAAKKILNACRYGRASLDLGWSARAAIIANSMMPSILGEAMALVNQLLPQPQPEAKQESRTGWGSRSEWAPSKLTKLADSAIEKNNELRGHTPQQIYAKQSG